MLFASANEEDSILILFSTNENVVLNGLANVFDANPTTPDSDPQSDSFSVTDVFDSDTNFVPVGVQTALPSGALLTQNSDGTSF